MWQELLAKPDPLAWLTADGRVFYAADADQNDPQRHDKELSGLDENRRASVLAGRGFGDLLSKLELVICLVAHKGPSMLGES